MKELPIAFAQELANKLGIGAYSLNETLSFHSRNSYYTPDIIIYKAETPYIIVELKNNYSNQERLLNRSFVEISRAQDYFKIEWSILSINDKDFYLRHLNEKIEFYSNIDEIVDHIRSKVFDKDEPFIGKNHIEKDYIEYFKSIVESTVDKLPRKDHIIHFFSNLKSTDFIVNDGYICFVPQKENDFFKSLLVPVIKGNICRYTSSKSLFTLLRSGKQNMLSLNCMNDISEIDYADKYINLDTIILNESIKESNNIFILSCCDETMSDDLMMWRLYAQNAEGVNLKYHIYTKYIDYEHFYLAKISYGQSAESHIELELIQKMLEWSDDGIYFKFNKWMIWKHFFKSYHYRYENEIRLLYYEYDESKATETIWIEDDNSGIYSPMKLFDIRKMMQSKYPLGLIGIKLGPRNKETVINKVQIENMYNEAKVYCPGLKSDINVSDIDIYR